MKRFTFSSCHSDFSRTSIEHLQKEHAFNRPKEQHDARPFDGRLIKSGKYPTAHGQRITATHSRAGVNAEASEKCLINSITRRALLVSAMLKSEPAELIVSPWPLPPPLPLLRYITRLITLVSWPEVFLSDGGLAPYRDSPSSSSSSGCPVDADESKQQHHTNGNKNNEHIPLFLDLWHHAPNQSDAATAKKKTQKTFFSSFFFKLHDCREIFQKKKKIAHETMIQNEEREKKKREMKSIRRRDIRYASSRINEQSERQWSNKKNFFKNCVKCLSTQWKQHSRAFHAARCVMYAGSGGRGSGLALNVNSWLEKPLKSSFSFSKSLFKVFTLQGIFFLIFWFFFFKFNTMTIWRSEHYFKNRKSGAKK